MLCHRNVVFFLVLFPLALINSARAIEVRFACGPYHDRRLTVIAVNDADGDRFTQLETRPRDNSSDCVAVGQGTPMSKLVLVIKQPKFEKCGFKIENNGDLASVELLLQDGDPAGKLISYAISCDFTTERMQTVETDLQTYKFNCAEVGEFFCRLNGKCMNANSRCAGSEDVPINERCLDAAFQEQNCDANNNGTYNIRIYRPNNVVTWIVYRGFAYLLVESNGKAKEEDIDSPKESRKFAEASKTYVSGGTSVCLYNKTRQFDIHFNELVDFYKKNSGSCFEYFKGFLTLLRDNCEEYSQDTSTSYVHKTVLKEGAAADCAYEKFASAAGSHLGLVALVILMYAVNLSLTFW